ncbi:MAG: M1 family metallopeptidase, partial [Marinirhabdus sp.]|nr:M1 family metallopeptidase [Marinirhabdus sp.]
MKYILLFFLFTSIGFAQQTDRVDFKQISATVQLDDITESVSGSVGVQFEMKQAADSVYLDAVNMTVTQAANEAISVSATSDKIWLKGPFKAGKQYTAKFNFAAKPKQTLYFTGNQIWTQGQGKYTSHWLPSIDDMNDKIEFDLTIEIDDARTVIANGKRTAMRHENGMASYVFDMEQPMASYLVAFAVGNFKKQSITSATSIPIDVYLSEADTAYFEPTFRYTKEIFDFLEKEIGVPYPWQNYKQVPVRDFLYAGMENTTATLFSEAFVVDSTAFVDRNYVTVNAHELAHQWFGNLVTETSGTHHWLQEGFATYYALLAERNIFGDDYYYWKLYQSAEQLKALSDEGKGESLLNAGASSL